MTVSQIHSDTAIFFLCLPFLWQDYPQSVIRPFATAKGKTRQPAQRIVAFQTTACFNENNVSFYEKQRVLLMKTTCRFMKNNGLFSANVRRQKNNLRTIHQKQSFSKCKNTYNHPFTRVRVRTHHRSFCFFAVTSVTPQS